MPFRLDGMENVREGWECNNIRKRTCEHEHELMNKNKYIQNILMTGTKYAQNIPMPRRNDMENIFPHVHG